MSKESNKSQTYGPRGSKARDVLDEISCILADFARESAQADRFLGKQLMCEAEISQLFSQLLATCLELSSSSRKDPDACSHHTALMSSLCGTTCGHPLEARAAVTTKIA